MGAVYTRYKNRIAKGELVSAEIVSAHYPPGKCKSYAISPALVLTFSDGKQFPLRSELWSEFRPLISIPVQEHRITKSGEMFSGIKVPTKGEYFWKLVDVVNEKAYYIHTSGIVAVRYKHGKERILTSYIGNHRKAVIKIGTRLCPVKHLVAEAMYPSYVKGTPVICKDKNELNCDYKNLVVIGKKRLGQLTGHKSKSQSVRAYLNGEWKTFRSVRECASAICCSYQTVLDYLKGKVKNSVCKPYKVSTLNI